MQSGHQRPGWIAGLNLSNVGFLIATPFVAVWAIAVAYWKIARVEHRWRPLPDNP